MSFNYAFILAILITAIQLNSSQRDCNSINQNKLILNTLNGRILGACYNYTINYQNKPPNTNNPIIKWLAVPYAEPPIGINRFKNPIPVQNWTNTRDGTIYSNNCMQYEKMNQSKTSEDCLFLNINTPYSDSNTESQLLPIFVWIHGGRWIYGSANEYDASTLSAVTKIVTITINYRLGPFGFTYIKDTEAQGNQAILDQQLALKWIYENAAQYGGDNSRITICGESAGYHLIFKQSWPYFTNAILQSGAPTRLDYNTLLLTTDEATSETYRIGALVDCLDVESNQKLLECLQNVDELTINKVFNEETTYAAFALDDNLFNSHPKLLFKNGEFKKCNIMVGTTTHEEASLAQFEIEDYIDDLYIGDFTSLRQSLMLRLSADETTVDKIIDYYVLKDDIDNRNINYYYYFVNMITDYQYKCPTYEFAYYLSKYKTDTFVFLYEQSRSLSNEKDEQFDGEAHKEEIDFIFGVPLLENGNFTASEKRFSEQIINFWVNFVKSGKPSLNNQWKIFNSFNSSTKRNIYFLKDKNITNITILLNDKTCRFWNDLNIANYFLKP